MFKLATHPDITRKPSIVLRTSTRKAKAVSPDG